MEKIYVNATGYDRISFNDNSQDHVKIGFCISSAIDIDHPGFLLINVFNF